MLQTRLQATVRRARTEDVGPLTALLARIAEEPGTEAHHLDARELLDDASVVAMLALEGATPVGVAVLRREATRGMRLELLSVLVDARGRAIGRALFNNALFAVLPVPALRALVPADRDEAIGWLVRRGFRELPIGDVFGAGQLVELELRLDAPAHGCGCGEDGCNGGSCAH